MSIDKTYIDYETYKKEVAEVGRLKQENNYLREHVDNLGNLHFDEIEKLKNDLNIMLEQEEKRQGFTDAVMDENNKLNIQNKQLREALRMCSPYVFIQCTPCKFCRVPEGNGHTEDCEYIKLTGVQE